MAEQVNEGAGEPTIRLDHLLKREGLAETGGHAKQLIQAGEVLVNGEIETRRRRQVKAGDVIQLHDLEIEVSGDGG